MGLSEINNVGNVPKPMGKRSQAKWETIPSGVGDDPKQTRETIPSHKREKFHFRDGKSPKPEWGTNPDQFLQCGKRSQAAMGNVPKQEPYKVGNDPKQSGRRSQAMGEVPLPEWEESQTGVGNNPDKF